MGSEDLIEVVSGQITFGAVEGDGLLRAHHDGVGEAAQQHDKAKDDVHDADALMVDAREPLVPEIAPQLEVRDGAEHDGTTERNTGKRRNHDGFVQRQRVERQPSENRFQEVGIIKHL